jgi:hypothetical protein
MPAHRIGILPMTPAQRQARHRAKLRGQPSGMTATSPAPRPTPRPKRWAAAENLEGSVFTVDNLAAGEPAR